MRFVFCLHRARNHQEGGDSLPSWSQVQGNSTSAPGPGPHCSEDLEGPNVGLALHCAVRSYGNLQVHQTQSRQL